MESSGIVGTLGLKPDVLIAQLVNFLIILFVLWRWAYKPLLKILDERTQKIERGLHDAEQAHEKLRAAEAHMTATRDAARLDAASVVKEAEVRAEKKHDEILTTARAEVGALVADARKKIGEERTAAATELKTEVARIATGIAEKILAEKLDAKKDAELIERVAAATKKHLAPAPAADKKI